MKNRIFAVLVIILMCFSMITPVFAATTTTYKGTELVWESTVYNGDVYQIKYFHPQGYDKVYIVNHSGSANIKNWNFIYYNDSTKFGTKYQITGGSVIQATFSGRSYASPTFAQLEANTKSLLFNENDADYRTKNFALKTANDGETLNLIGGVPNPTGPLVIEVGTPEFENWYADWYYELNGFYPPLAGANTEDESKFMNGQYYAIFSQEAYVSGVATDENDQVISAYGYVDTVAPKRDIPLKTTYQIDDEYKGLLYVVVSSDTQGDLCGFEQFAMDGFIGTFVEIFTRFSLWTGIGDVERNNYNFIDGLIFYNNNNNVNRYYFTTIQDACKFVLYGTAGAEPVYEEIGQTDYGYGYISCEYNNYDMTGYSKKVIPMEQYPMGRQTIVLTQHDVQGVGKKYVYIELNYYSRVSMLDSDMNLIINNEYMLPEYFVYVQENELLDNATDKTLYTKTDVYDVSRTTTFPIYNSKTIDPKGTWDVVYSTYDYFQIKQGQILDGDEHPPVLQVGNDDKGNKVVYNTDTNVVYKNGETDPYIYNPDTGKYENSKGETVDLNDYTFATLEWQNTIKDYQDSFENLAELIEDFTGFINSSTEQVGEITGLLNAVMMSFPSIFRTLILMSFMALIFGRIIKRGH